MNPSPVDETFHPDALLAADALLPESLTPYEREQLAAHLAACPRCREVQADNRLMHQSLAETFAPARPDGGFEQRLARAFREQTGGQLWEWLRALSGRVRWGRRLVEALVILLILGVLASFAMPALQSSQVSALHARNVSLARQRESSARFDEDAKPPAAPPPVNGPSGAFRGMAVDEFQRSAQVLVPSPTPAAGQRQLVAGEKRDLGAALSDQKLAKDSGRAKNEDLPLTLPLAVGEPRPADADSKPTAPPAADPDPGRKLIRNAAVELLLAGPFDPAADALANLAREAGGYIASNADSRQPNGKRRGTVVLKVLPDRLDPFLLRLRELGEVRGQNVSTQDVTKAYFDTEARLRNAARLEERLLKMLDEVKGKLSEVLQVEKELARIREEAEKMQGELKVMDALVRFATVTVTLTERDLDQPAAFLLRRNAILTLLAGDVERTLADARRLAVDAGAQVTAARTDRDGAGHASATLGLLVAPEKADNLFAALRGLGRVERFNVTDERIIQDGAGGRPGLDGKTTLAPVALDLAIRHDEQTSRRTTLTVAAANRDVDAAFERARAAAGAVPGAEVVQSFLNHPSEGRANATLGVRLPGRAVAGLADGFRALGRATDLQTQRDAANAPEDAGAAPELLTLTLVDEETAVQETRLRVEVAGAGVEATLPAIRQAAAGAGAETRRSTFERAGDGAETAELRFRLPLQRAPALVARLQTFGRTRDFTVRRQDRPNVTDENNAPAEIGLTLQSPGRLFNEDAGLWATLRRTLAQSVAAIGWSARAIGVAVAFVLPWAIALALAWWVLHQVRRRAGR